MSDGPRKPNLFIIGAQKSGTTSLHGYLATHPEISMSRMKEPAYFVEELNLAKGERWYFSLFEAEACHRYVGESSTFYTMLPVYKGVPERIFRFNPEARLIYIMRNPFERMLSHYWHAVRNIYVGGERRPLLKAVTEEPDDHAGSVVRGYRSLPYYLAFSDYAMQLEPYIKQFGRVSIFTLTFEALIRDPQREVSRIYDWLGLQGHQIGGVSGKIYNAKPKNFVGVAGAGILNRIEYSQAWSRVSPYVPTPLKNWARKRAYRPIDESQSEEDILALKERVGDIQKRQVARLSRLLGRDFPEWSESPSIRRLIAGKEEGTVMAE